MKDVEGGPPVYARSINNSVGKLCGPVDLEGFVF